MKNLIYKNPSALINMKAVGFTSTHRTILGILIREAQNTKTVQTMYTIPVERLLEIFDTTYLDKMQTLKQYLKDLCDITVNPNMFNKDKKDYWAISALLASAKIPPYSGMLEYSFSYHLNPMILSPKVFALIDLLTLKRIKSNKYAVALYMFLFDWLGSFKIPSVTIEEFRDILGVYEDTHCMFKNFRTCVLDSSVLEINEHTDLVCKYSLTKKGTTYTSIEWEVSAKPDTHAAKYFPTKVTGYIINENKEYEDDGLN